MAKYRVEWKEISLVTAEVEADNENEAFDLARDGRGQVEYLETIPDSLTITKIE